MDKIQKFILEYKGPPISIIALGAGTQISKLLSYPGASKIIESIILPYSRGSVQRLLNSYKIEKYNSPDLAKSLAEKSLDFTETGVGIGVGITGALTTNRERKGDNVVYICFCIAENDKEYKYKEFKLKFPKLSSHEFQDYSNVLKKRKDEEESVLDNFLDNI